MPPRPRQRQTRNRWNGASFLAFFLKGDRGDLFVVGATKLVVGDVETIILSRSLVREAALLEHAARGGVLRPRDADDHVEVGRGETEVDDRARRFGGDAGAPPALAERVSDLDQLALVEPLEHGVAEQIAARPVDDRPEAVARIAIRAEQARPGEHGLLARARLARAGEPAHDRPLREYRCEVRLEVGLGETAQDEARRFYGRRHQRAAFQSIVIAAIAARRCTISRSPGSMSLRTSAVSSGPAKATYTRPTGFSSLPPPGPATPVTAIAHDARRCACTPTAIAVATSALTAPCCSMRSGATSRKSSFASFAYETTPPR